nr:piggyBac transposable element-derived protein 1-like [Danaus plexippus plexippus]
MPLKKFEKIRSTLHFADDTLCLPKDHPDYDRLFKIRPLEETLNCQFGKVPLDQRLSIDEQMCATKMSHYIKQYMPNKPHKWGFKLYLICSLQGYAHRFEVYSGGGSKNNILPGEPDLGKSGNTVVRIARMVPRNVNHIIYFDNFYTSVPLVTYLAKEGIFSLGTVRVNRLRNCKLPEKNTIMKKNVPRGFYEENVAAVDDIDVSAVVWKDNKPVNLLSTYVGAEPATTVTRFDKSKKERVAIPCPKVIKELELAETLCKLGLPANGAKRGRPSGSTIQRELVMKKFCGPAQAIPLKDVRLDQTCHWAVWLDKAAEVQIPEMFRLYI